LRLDIRILGYLLWTLLCYMVNPPELSALPYVLLS